MFFYPELKDDKLFAENFVKTGLCGDSDKYYKILKDQKLTSKEIEKLLLDRHISGYDFWTNKQWSLNGKDEEGIIFQYSKVTDHIKVWVEDDMFCRQWNILFGGLKDCAYVYKNLEGDVENKDEYILATDYGFYGFSVVE